MEWIHVTQDKVQWQLFCEHGNKPSGSIKGQEYLDHMKDHDSAHWSLESSCFCYVSVLKQVDKFCLQ
jgi:hypothetical protein